MRPRYCRSAVARMRTQNALLFYHAIFPSQYTMVVENELLSSILNFYFSLHLMCIDVQSGAMSSCPNTNLIFLSPRRTSPFSRGVIFTRVRVSLALLSLRKMGTTLVYIFTDHAPCLPLPPADKYCINIVVGCFQGT